MAKRRLKQPCLPPGDRVSFFEYMQELVLENGDQPVAKLGDLIQASHQAVYKVLTGPKVPSRALTMRLAEKLAGESARDEAVRRWQLAVREEVAHRESEARDRSDVVSPAPGPGRQHVDVAPVRTDGHRHEAGQGTFAATLDAFVRANGGVQSVAARTGVAGSTLYAWMSGKNTPRSERFDAFLEAIAERRNGFDMSGEARLQAARLELREKDRANDRADAQKLRELELMDQIRSMDRVFDGEGVYE